MRRAKGKTKIEVKPALTMEDESVFSIPSGAWAKALKMKLNNENIKMKEFERIFKKEVAMHWKNRTVPTKFGFNDTWAKDLEDEYYWDEYYKIEKKRFKEFENYVKKQIGINFTSIIITPQKHFESHINEQKQQGIKIKIIRDGIALEEKNGKELIMRRDTPEHQAYEKINNKYNNIIRQKVKERLKKEPKEKIELRYKNHAELAEVVLYQYLRAYIMGIALGELSKGKSGVIALGKDRVTQIKGDTSITEIFNKEEKNDTGDT